MAQNLAADSSSIGGGGRPPSSTGSTSSTTGTTPWTAQTLQHLTPATENQPIARNEVAFLVTNWLAHGINSTGNRSSSQIEIADPRIRSRIRRATAELAGAFADAGLFGQGRRDPFAGVAASDSDAGDLAITRNLSFADARRRWGHSCPPDQLSRLLEAIAAATRASGAFTTSTPNLLQLSHEVRQNRLYSTNTATASAGVGGRSVEEAIDVDQCVTTGSSSGLQNTGEGTHLSALHRPVWLIASSANPELALAGSNGDMRESASFNSTWTMRARHASNLMRKFLDLRNQCQSQNYQLLVLQKSLRYQKNVLVECAQKRARLDSLQSDEDPFSRSLEVDELQTNEQNSSRVIAQLNRQIAQLSDQNSSDQLQLSVVQKSAKTAHGDYLEIRRFCDPFHKYPKYSLPRNHLLQHTLGREIGSRSLRADNSHLRKHVMETRLSFGATINSHLTYPIYCLRFDRSGRYFVTGADDYLAKVFCLGRHVHAKPNAMDRESYIRGAILVCTLRGHAGVINDISVSSDNAFLATASEDGDCRVWGLHDGTPVAILRGHVGGANMVAWSNLTPYRLVTGGADGFARVWDIRDACRKRYKHVIGKRSDYSKPPSPEARFAELAQVNVAQQRVSVNESATLASQSTNIAVTRIGPSEVGRLSEVQLSENNASADDVLQHGTQNVQPVEERTHPVADSETAVELSQSPLTETESHSQSQYERRGNDPADIPLPALPLPPPIHNAAGEEGDQPNQVIAPGQFTAGDKVDEGVRLISKLSHGATGDERRAGPSTRNHRGTIKVLCVAICPSGSHFTTGADDGVCRVFSAVDDAFVATNDILEQNHFGIIGTKSGRKPNLSFTAKSKCLHTLKGHHSAITDLQYSNGGDRLMSASQKDGVLRIWSWNGVSSSSSSGLSSGLSRTSQVSHVLIRLTNPCLAQHSQTPQVSKRRPNRSTPPNSVTCDVATWVHDDSKIITSQSEQVKQSTSEIQPGSQYIFVWDSRSGQCILGINGAHTMQCPVVIPHPLDSTIACSAGADGKVYLWNLETGRKIFSHQNIIEYGPLEQGRHRGDKSGFLDGCFAPNGDALVLTDDAGRVTVVDCLTSSHEKAAPIWMREQYFGNDYYDLSYDSDGYCIESGCGQPPHLAPRGARCTNSGAPWPDTVNFAFKNLTGPMPTIEKAVVWNRIRRRADGESLLPRQSGRRGNVVGQFDPQTTTLVSGSGNGEIMKSASDRITIPDESQLRHSHTTRRPRQLSENWRWGDYDDILLQERYFQENEEELDPDDDEFQLETGGTTGRVLNENDESQSDMSVGLEESPARPRSRVRSQSRRVVDSESEQTIQNVGTEESPARPRSRARSQTRRVIDSESEQTSQNERVRASSRRPRQRSIELEQDSSEDEDFVEYLSSNNEPSGPFIVDYDLHFFRLQRNDRIERSWLARFESNTSYDGRKSYSPQLGDSVVYIPRAHLETIEQFPTLSSPWHQFPEEAEWPVVRCSIRWIRYRFPYKQYFSKNNGSGACLRGVVALLTLEVTGIPELSRDEGSFWPKPSFISPTKCHLFELPLFENVQTAFVVPESLYLARVTALEHIMKGLDQPQVESFFVKEGNGVEEDEELEPYSGHIVGLTGEPAMNDPNLCVSGYEAVQVKWDALEDSVSSMGTWEVKVCDPAYEISPQRPRMDDGEKRLIRRALGTIEKLPGVSTHFVEPVDDQKFSDYDSRIEVPMSIRFIKQRIESDYYGCKLGVVSDVRLIAENCLKYNGYGDVSDCAMLMHQKFLDLVLSEEEKSSYVGFQERVEKEVAERRSEVEQSAAHTASEGEARSTLPAQLIRTSQRSSLESLPAPSTAHDSRNRSQNNLQSSASVAETERQIAVVPPMAAGRRGRTTRNSRGQQPNPQARAAEMDRDISGEVEVTTRESTARQLRSNRRIDITDIESPQDNLGRSTRARSASQSQQSPSAPVPTPASPSRSRSVRIRIRIADNGRGRRVRADSDNTESSGAGSSDEDTPQSTTRRSRTSSRTHAKQKNNESDATPKMNDSAGEESDFDEDEVQEDSSDELDEDSSHASIAQSKQSTRKRTRKSNAQVFPPNEDHTEVRGTRSRRTRQSLPSSLESLNDFTSSEEQNGRLLRGVPNRSLRSSSQRGRARDENASRNSHRQVADSSITSRPQRSRTSTGENSGSPRNGRARSQPNRRSGRVVKREINDEIQNGFESRTENRRSLRRGHIPTDLSQNSNGRSSRSTAFQRNPATVVGSHGTKSRGKRKRKGAMNEAADSGDEQQSSPRRAARNRAATSYLDPDSSEFGSDVEDDLDEPVVNNRRRQVPKKRSNPATKRTNASKRRKTTAESEEEDEQGEEFFVPKKWPDVGMKDITIVATSILSKLRDVDEDGIFALPVSESYPDMAEDYDAVIDEPMDFQTIEEDRLHVYRSISEFQQDLILVFHNCLRFNKPASEYGQLARLMLDMLEETFRVACREHHVLLPRRW